jgi:hypothetical protein
LEEVSAFNYYGCNISYQCSQDPEIKLQKYLQLTVTTKRTLLHKVRLGTIKKFHRTMVRPVLLYGSEIWISTVTQYGRFQAVEMQLLRSWQAIHY